jgi:hypothetical protein
MVNELIYSLKDDHIDDIYENIIDHEYKEMAKQGNVDKSTYKELLKKYKFENNTAAWRLKK